MREHINRLLNLRPGEGRKTALLYSLHFIFYVGLLWGEAASIGLFMGTWGADYLRYIFIGDALLAFGLGLVYTSFADKVSNARLLVALSLVVAGCLLVMRVVLGINASPTNLVYPSFLLLFRAFRRLSTLQILNYINDFYDTRAAKRALPLMTSAAVTGAALAGFVTAPMIDLLGVENVILGWAACLSLVIVLVWLCERLLGQERGAQMALESAGLAPLGATGGGTARRKGNLDNLRDGFRFVKNSPFLRLLAVATVAMAFVNNLFNFQASWAIAQRFPSAEDQTVFYAMLGSVANLLSLFVQVLLLGRLVTWLGVGIANLIFPLTSLLTYGLLGIRPNLLAAVGGWLNNAAVKRSFRNPLDAMLYNTVPIQVKGRARAFINGMLVPVSVFVVGGLLFLVPRQASLPGGVVGLGIGGLVLYVALALRLRSEYGKALVRMLEEEDFALYRLASADLSIPDKLTFNRLVQRLETSPDDDFTIFLAEVIVQAGGRQALPVLQQLAVSGSTQVRGAVLTMLGEADFAGAEVRELCLSSLSDDASVVRRAAIGALFSLEDQAFLTAALQLLDDPDLEVRAHVIPPLMQSGDFFYQAAAIRALSGLLESQDGVQRAVGICILGELDDARFIRTLADYLDDPDDEVRRQAALAMEHLSTLPMPEWLLPLALEAACGTLKDTIERIRLVGVVTLKQLGGPKARKGLLFSLTDSSRPVRERAAEALQGMGVQAVSDLEAALGAEGQDQRQQEAISVILARIEHERFMPLINRQIEYNLRAGYETLAALTALDALPSKPGVLILKETLGEYNRQRLERIFDLIASVRPPQSVQVVAEHLRSPSPRVRANAVEALESLTSPRTARLIAPLTYVRDGPTDLGEFDRAEALALGQEAWDLSPPTPRGVLQDYSQGGDPWLQAVTVHVLGQVGLELFGREELEQILGRWRDESQDRDVRQASQIAWSRLTLDSTGGEAALPVERGKEGVVLSTIERVIFLKEVPFFESMTIEQLRVLASVSEECTYDEDEMVFAEGDTGDALYIVVSGRIGIERAGMRKGSVVRLATLSSRQYFGEMSIFDEAPRSASAVALEPTLLLSLRRAPLVALARENPDLSLELIRVLSRRLRDANRQITERSKARPRELEKLYDKLRK